MSSEDAGNSVTPEDVAAERLVRDNMAWMRALAEQILNDRALAEDTVQEALVNALRSLDSFQQKSDIKTWLHRITVNAAITKLRQQRRLAEQSLDELLPEFDRYDCRVEPPWTQLASVEDVSANEESRSFVSGAIRSLPDSHRLVLQLRDIEGYATRETAEILEISESNVKVRLHRARAALKKLLEPVLRRPHAEHKHAHNHGIMRRLKGAMLKNMHSMITCRQFEDFVLRYLDDELPAAQKRTFEWHLRICRECRDYLAAYQRAIEVGRAVLGQDAAPVPAEVPEDLVLAVLEARRA